MRPPLYIHIPYCLKKCGYCDFFSKPSVSVPAEYVRAVAMQIDFLAREFCVEEWKSVYIGGGTPSLLEPSGLIELCRAVTAAAPLASDCEWTIEVNPGSVSRELLEAARACGINRLSVGIQCKNQKVLDAIARVTTVSQIEEAVSLAKNFWRGSWSADLIAGLPFQTKEDLERDIDFVASNGADHVSLYSLTLEEGTPLAKKIERGELPYDEEAAEELWLYGRDLLEARGFLQYEVSNFAKPGFESRHNSAYWAQESYLGAGAGATGTIYGKPNGMRYTNVLDAAEYIKFWNAPVIARLDRATPKGFTDLNGGGQKYSQAQEAPQKALQDLNGAATPKGFTGQNAAAPLPFPCQLESLDMDTQEFEYIMTNLRTRRGACAEEYRERYGKDLAARLGHSKWVQTIERDGKTYCAMTREGLLFLNRFLEEL
ncbi:MAG: radical SAM family heme chaperone HemW [Treponema sp.]|nr:radical SAM family heme chaperone HemW [Treponema sp.]